MNLAIDIGNTLIKIGAFEGAAMKEVQSFESNVESLVYINKKRPDNIIISTVRSQEDNLINSVLSISNCIILNSATPLPVTNLYKTPDTLGPDRVSACIGAYSLFPKTNCLVIDCGTCIKCDMMDKNGSFHGGSISPGVKMRFEALNYFTAKLPLIQEKPISFLTGQSTEDSILSGVINGALFEIEGFIDNYSKIFSQLNVILTGGDAGSFESKIKQHIFVIPNLVLLGLNKILLYNLSNTSA